MITGADLEVVEEVWRENVYRLGQFEKTDLVVDIGAHCGVFAVAALTRGAGKVWCYEPWPETFARLQNTMAPFGDLAELHPLAAWKSNLSKMDSIPMHRDAHTDQTATCVHGGTDGVMVKTVSLDTILSGQQVRFLKIDIEGLEYPVVFTSDLIGSNVQEVVVKTHDRPRGAHCNVDGFQNYPQYLVNFLKQRRFEVTFEEDRDHPELGMIHGVKHKTKDNNDKSTRSEPST